MLHFHMIIEPIKGPWSETARNQHLSNPCYLYTRKCENLNMLQLSQDKSHLEAQLAQQTDIKNPKASCSKVKTQQKMKKLQHQTLIATGK